MTQPVDPLFIRLYIDEDVHKRLASALRLRHFDVMNAHEMQRRGLSDKEQLTFASEAGRAIFTYNTTDYLDLHFEWLQQNRSYSGIIISNQVSIGETIRCLLNLLNRVTAEEMRNQLFWLQSFR